MLKWIIGCRLR